MLPRSLVPIVLCVAATWSLRAFACINSMDPPPFIVSTQAFWLDMILWPVGAVFLNRIVLVNVRGLPAEGQAKPSMFRRSFFLLVGVALVLLFAGVSAGVLLLGLSSVNLSGCAVDGSTLLGMAAIPTLFFVLQAVLFLGFSNKWFGDRRASAIVSLVLTSVLLSIMVDVKRDEAVLQHCEPESKY